MVVHSILARQLTSCSHLVEQIRPDALDTDIFGQINACAEWRRVVDYMLPGMEN